MGNLVCPVEFDCGEDAKIALLSVTEGDDKPEKYPLLFNRASAMILNKIDLLPYVDFDVEVAARHARHLNADLALFEVSCRTGEGLEKWYSWLRQAAESQKECLSIPFGNRQRSKKASHILRGFFCINDYALHMDM